jgi:AcrR family transcriptional regulator
MPKAFSEHEKETIRAQMREKGKKLFEKQGLKKTSVDELTEAVGISKGAFYLFYESKEELFLEIMEQLEKDIQASILAFTMKPKANARQSLKSLLWNFLVSWEDYPLLKNFTKSEFDYLIRKIPAQRVQEHTTHDEEFINGFLQKMKSEGIMVKAPPRTVTNLVKTLFIISLHRDDIGEEIYKESMNILTGLVAGYILGE